MRRPPAPRTAVHRGLVALLATCVATLGILATGMSAAQAHDQLVGSVPARGATLASPPSQIELRFGGKVQELGTQVVVAGEGGRAVSAGAVQIDGSSVMQPLTGELPAGTYTVQWRATSADGHPLSDEFSFTVAGGTATRTTAGTSSASAAWIVGGAVLVLLAGAGLALRLLRRPA